jgi:hypothetical protein
MPYQINRYNGQPLVTVDEGTLNNQSTTLRLIGKNYAGYGDIQNENFVYLTENFSNSAPPPNALSGQIWYDSANRKLKFWDAARWRTTGGAEIGTTPPTGLTTGDFWWNTDSQQLYAYDGVSNFVLIGPQSVPGSGRTNWESISLLDDQNNRHAVMIAYIDGKAVYIVSKDTFNLNQIVNPIVGFGLIHQGMTQVDTNTSGVTTTSYRFWGTASDTDKLGGKNANEYVTSLNAVFSGVASFDDEGFTVGNDDDLRVWINTDIPTIQNQVSNNIKFKVKNGANLDNVAQVLGIAFDPGITDTYDLGEPTLRWRKIYGKEIYGETFYGGTFVGTFTGASSKADTLLFARASTVDKYRSATDLTVGDSIVARDSNGDFSANIVNAIATRAQYADLAERYEADGSYEPGTVVIFGGEKEITLTNTVGDYRVAGVVSTAPAYLMNDHDKDSPPIALRGKVPVKVTGKVNKGDILITSEIPGYAIVAANPLEIPAASIVAKAIDNKVDDGLGVVMAVIV